MNEKQTLPGGRAAEDENLSAADKRRMAEQIGRQLRGMYDGLLNQPLPDRLTDLVKQLEGRTGRRETRTVSEGTAAKATKSMRSDLLSVVPNLRAFAVSLCGNPDRADDLVQETLVKAWSNFDSFVEGTNLPAWLFTILRNIYYSEYRKRRREVSDSEGLHAARLASAPAQTGHMDFLDFREALQKLPHDQREALILIGASGLSYEEAAAVCNCAVGTMKSRVNRARNRLAEILTVVSGAEYGQSGDWTLEGGEARLFSKTGSD